MEDAQEHKQTQDEQPELEEFKVKLEQCKKEKDEFIDIAKRLKADFANFKKEQEKVVGAVIQLAAKEVVSRLLPVMDSLELASKNIPKDLDRNGWVEGVKNITQQLAATLKEIGVVEVPTVGQEFDPERHEAVAQEESDEEEWKILEELQKGYTLHGRVLRPAKVTIATKKKDK